MKPVTLGWQRSGSKCRQYPADGPWRCLEAEFNSSHAQMVPSIPPAATRQPREVADSAALGPPENSPDTRGRPRRFKTSAKDRKPPPAAARFFGEKNGTHLRWCQKGRIGGTPREGGWGPGTSTVPTERPGKFRCLPEPPARAGSPLAAEGAAPGRAAHVAPPSALSTGERERGDRATARRARLTGKLGKVPGSSEPEGGQKQPLSAWSPLPVPFFVRRPAAARHTKVTARAAEPGRREWSLLPRGRHWGARPGIRGAPRECRRTRPVPPPRACTNWPQRTPSSWRRTAGVTSW